MCTGKKEHEKMSTKVVVMVLHFNSMITGSYFLLDPIYLHFYRVYGTLYNEIKHILLKYLINLLK